jgi:hypothetical protein
MKPIRVVVNDRMQHGFVYYRTEPIGRNFDEGFEPQLKPAEMLRLGVFGGKYMTDCRKEFPASWFAHAKLCAERHDPKLNLFAVNASQPLSVWRKKGWIYPDDPRGWFQWYCRYYMGRRSLDDEPANQTLARDAATCGPDPPSMPSARPRLPSAPAPGLASLGVRQP